MTKRGKGPEGPAGRKRFVLVVDNNQRDGNGAGMLLQNLGYTSMLVRSGEEALELVARVAPAIILSELVLPGMNGIDLLGRLSQDSALPAVPVIILTRFSDLESEDHCRRSGAAGCLNKPVQSTELFRTVQQIVEPTPRRNIRVPAMIPASIDDRASGKEYVTALSDSGLFIRTAEPRQPGSKHAVTFLLGDRVIRVDAAVLYANRFEEDPRKEPGMGMKFLNLTAVDLDAIQSHIRDTVAPGIVPEGGN